MRMERIGQATLYQGDCLTVLPSLPVADAFITDPPYGLGMDYGAFIDTPENVTALHAGWLPLARERAGRVVITPGVLGQWMLPRPDWVMCWAISGAGGRGKWGFSCWQPIVVYGPDPYLAAGMGARPDLLFVNETSEKNGHPCPKPIGFMRRLIDRVSLGGLIVDPFMGSGTTGAAAMELGRPFIGVELEPAFFDIACERIENAQRQERLFA
jgi:site-specific DNA-methyltransferase (adenine-specific)